MMNDFKQYKANLYIIRGCEFIGQEAAPITPNHDQWLIWCVPGFHTLVL